MHRRARRSRVLVVCEGTAERDAYMAAFLDAGYSVLLAATPNDACRLSSELPADAIVALDSDAFPFLYREGRSVTFELMGFNYWERSLQETSPATLEALGLGSCRAPVVPDLVVVSSRSLMIFGPPDSDAFEPADGQPIEVEPASILGRSVRFPSRFLLVAAMNPCPCGDLGHPRKPCRCTPSQVRRYLNRISGPLLDRIDLHVELQPGSPEPPGGGEGNGGCGSASERRGEGSVAVRRRVEAARARQIERGRGRGFACNAAIPAGQVATVVAAKHPKVATVERMVKRRPRGTVYVDFLQNILGKTLATAYSARASAFAGVSTPIKWEELDETLDPRDYTIVTAPQRFREVGDLWARLRTSKPARLDRVFKKYAE